MINSPKDLEDIIYDYKHQLDFSKTIDEINKIEYSTETDYEGRVWFTRKYKNKETRGFVSSYSRLVIFVDDIMLLF